MKIVRLTLALVAMLSTGFAASVFAGGAQNKEITVSPLESCPGGAPDAGDVICYSVKGWSKGNHEIDCTVIEPDNNYGFSTRPLIAWANGWDQGNVLGQNTTKGYLKGLKRWAIQGNFLVVAANAWSAQESDVLNCAQAVAEYDGDDPEFPDVELDDNGDYLIGLAGHSQGGGAVIKAGDGNKDISIESVLAMNPYGPGWVRPENQDGPVLILGGALDATTPPSSYQAVADAIQAQGDPGGINAISNMGTHNSDAWGTYDDGTTMTWEDAQDEDFGNFQEVGLYWFGATLNGLQSAKDALNNALFCPVTPWGDLNPWVDVDDLGGGLHTGLCTLP